MEKRLTENVVSVEQTRTDLEDLKNQFSALEDQTTENGSLIGLLSTQLEVVGEDLAELIGRVIADSYVMEELAADMEKAITEIRSSANPISVSTGSLPTFDRNSSDDTADRLFRECFVGRMAGLIGSMGPLFREAIEEEIPIDAFTGFTSGEISHVDEIAVMGAFLNCWTIGNSLSFDIDLTENEAEQIIYDCLWSRMYGWRERTPEEWEFIDVEIIEGFLQPVPDINTSALTRKEMISIWGALLGCWSIEDQ